jgi:putative oxidoreductase
MFEQANLREPRNVLGDWILRGAIALVFILFGAEKFSSSPESPWVKLFQQIGVGQWFRYFTGMVEVLGGVLVFIPWTVTAGLALLASTMAAAALILVFVIGRPADSIVSAGLFIGLAAFWWSRRTR